MTVTLMPRLKKRSLQISLRATLLLLCLSGFVVAYLVDVKKRQVEVQQVVSELGGYVNYVDFGKGRQIDSPRIEFIPNCFYIILPEKLNYVNAPSEKVDDAKLAKILKLPGIQGLNISSSTITDKGLLMLKRRSGLKEILLEDIQTVTEEAILKLKASNDCNIQH